MEGTKMNLTYVEEKFTGSCTDAGNYTGILESLDKNLSDWSLIPFSELNCSRSEHFSYGNVFSDLKNTLIHSHPRLDINSVKNESSLDIIADIPYSTCARLINGLFYVIFFLLISAGSLMASLHVSKVKQIKLTPSINIYWIRKNRRSSVSRKLAATASHILQVFSRQGLVLRTNRVSIRLLWILFMVHTFVGSTIYFSVFKTNLFKPRPVTRLNNLHDLAASKHPPYKARFPLETNTWKLFAESKVEPMKSIWERAQRVDEEDERFNKNGKWHLAPRTGPLLSYDREKKMPFIFLERADHFNWAVISHYANNRFVIEAFCFSYDVEGTDRKFQFYHSKESFLHAIIGIVFRKDLHPAKKREISRAISKVNQYGFHDYYDKNPQGVWRKTPLQRRCINMLQRTANLTPEEKVIDLSLVHFTRLLQIILAVLVVAVVILSHEMCVLGRPVCSYKKIRCHFQVKPSVKRTKNLPRNRVKRIRPSEKR